MPCPAAEPCCNNGTCHTTSMEACPISLGCDPHHSHLDGCFPLPACRSLKDQFKNANLLIPKHAFTGDPNQASWVSDFHHVAPYAKIDQHQYKLYLRARRDMVKTHSGGGFGATVSSTRWSKFGTFSAKLKSGSTGPGIVTAFLLSNPAMGEEISFELTGKDPKKVVTNYYRRIPGNNLDPLHSSAATRSRLESHEETQALKKDSTQHEMTYKLEWNEHHIKWFVDGKLIRTVLAKDTSDGLPTNPMQLQVTIWDAGHVRETMAWAGGMTQYGEDNLIEYVATVDAIEISCKDMKEGQKPWPGPEATRRLKQAQADAAASAKRYWKMNKGKQGDYGYEHEQGFFARLKRFFEWSVLTLIKWSCLLLSLIFGAAYFTEPKSTNVRVSSSSSSKNLGSRTE
ncbi:hypothetical protein BG005_003498 [Podila minutissima]|nr:hypothetical protein BG005_003498 [Podila minutissima]